MKSILLSSLTKVFKDVKSKKDLVIEKIKGKRPEGNFEDEEYLFFGKISQQITGGKEMLSPRFVKISNNEKIH